MQPTANGRPRRRFNLRHWLSAAKAKALYVLRLDRRLRHWDDERYLRLWYWLRRGRRLRLDPPVSFSEKQQWLKLHDRQPLYTTLVDKYEVKSWVADRVGERYVVPTLGVWDSFDEIDFDSLPESFVLKCTHDSGGLVICRARAELDLTAARATVQKSLGRSYFYKGREWPYRDVQPRVLAEVFLPTWVPDEAAGTSAAELELLDDPEGVVDYKFYCFHGEPRFLYVSQGLHDHSTARMDFLTLEWKLASFWRPDYYRFDTIPPKPARLDEMVSISRELSAGIPFVRVDLYEHLGRVLFSEMTFSPVSGVMPVSPRRADDDLGRLIDLSLVERRT